MKKVVLRQIQLKNWRGLNLDVTFNEAVTNVSATNGVGKTSLQTGWNWLLSGYTTANEPKNNNLFDNRVVVDENTPEASVKAWITIDGVEYTLQKTAKAKFTRKRGTNEYVKDSSDVYKTFVDDIEYSAVDYAEWITTNICSADKLEYCLDGLFLVALADDDKRKARKVLEDIIGEIKTEDFKDDYSCLANDFVKGYTIEQIEEKAKKQIKTAKEGQVSLPILIKDKENKLTELNTIDYSSIVEEIESKKRTIEDIDNSLLGEVDATKPIIERRDKILKEISSKTFLLNEGRNTYNNKRNAVISEIKGKISEIKSRNLGIVARNANKDSEFAFTKKRYESELAILNGLVKERDALREERDEVKGLIFTDEHCPMCGQELPLDMLEKAKKEFLDKKQARVDAIVTKGKAVADKIIAWEKLVEVLRAKIDKGVEYEVEEDFSELTKQLERIEQEYIPYEETDEYKTFVKEIEELKASLPEIHTPDNDTLLLMKRGLMNELEELNRRLARKDDITKLEKAILDLKEQYRIVSNEIIKLEGIVDKCKEWIEERANIVSLQINDKLKDCKIRMWDKQKNGELTPSCTILDKKDVKYTTTNNAERIKICLSLQQMFCKHFGVTLPLWVDESSIFASNNLPKFDSQTIYMFASNDTHLVVE